MGQQIYKWNNKIYYEVYVQGRDPQTKKRIQKKARFTFNGKRIPSKTTARQIEYQLKKEMEALTKGVCLWTWEKWHDEFLQRMAFTFKKSTLLSYNLNLKKWLTKEWMGRQMTDFEKAHVHHLLFKHLAEKISPIAQRTYLKRLHRIFEMAIEEGIIHKNPAKGITVKVPQKRQKVLSGKEVNQLLNEAKLCEHPYYPVWACALFTGMRSGEMYALRLSDINLEEGIIHVNRQFTPKDGLHETKGNNHRAVPISRELQPLLVQLIKQSGFEENLWKWANNKKTEKTAIFWDNFLLPRLRDWRNGDQAQALRNFCREISITEVKFHDLRASFITNMLSQGVPISVVMKVVGHSRMHTTDEYNRLAGVGVKGSTNKLGFHLPEGT